MMENEGDRPAVLAADTDTDSDNGPAWVTWAKAGRMTRPLGTRGRLLWEEPDRFAVSWFVDLDLGEVPVRDLCTALAREEQVIYPAAMWATGAIRRDGPKDLGARAAVVEEVRADLMRVRFVDVDVERVEWVPVVAGARVGRMGQVRRVVTPSAALWRWQ